MIPEARQPPPMRAPPDKRSINKYCEYHPDHGHDTKDCIFLKQKLVVQIYITCKCENRL
jgi:hypothetical protein